MSNDSTNKTSGMNINKLKESREVQPLSEYPISVTELCDRYEQLFTAAVNDVLRERNLLNQTLPNNIMPLRNEMKVAGLAFTVKGSKSLIVKDEMKERVEMLDSITADSVIAWDTSNDDESAQWGEVMTMAAVRKGCRGAVVDGGVRDTDRVLSQNFPIFVRYRSSNGMLGRFRITGWQQPIQIGQVYIMPGDLIFGDIDGVIVVPHEIAYEVLLRAEEIKETETDIKRWIREGMPAKEIVKKGGYF